MSFRTIREIWNGHTLTKEVRVCFDNVKRSLSSLRKKLQHHCLLEQTTTNLNRQKQQAIIMIGLLLLTSFRQFRHTNRCTILFAHLSEQFNSGIQRLTRCLLLSCQPRVTVISCFVYKVIRDLQLIDHLCINPICRIGLIHKWSIDSH